MKICPNCYNKTSKSIMKYRGFSKIFEKKYIISCLNYEIGYVYPQPSKVDISNYNKNNFEQRTLFFSKKSLQFTLIKSGFKKISLSYHGDTYNNIMYFELIKKVILKLSIILKLQVNFFFIKNFPEKIKKKLNQEEHKSLILTSPHKTSENPSR